MALIIWDPIQYSINVKEFDNDHMKIVNLINDLHDKMKEGNRSSIIENVLEEMLSYTSYHFKREEIYFELHNFPEAEMHKMEHQNFIDQVGELIGKYKKHDFRISIYTIDFLKDWLFSHILQSDRKYSEFLNSKGIY